MFELTPQINGKDSDDDEPQSEEEDSPKKKKKVVEVSDDDGSDEDVKPVVKKEDKKGKKAAKPAAKKSTAKGKKGDKKKKDEDADDVTIFIQQSVALTFSIKYLGNFSKSTPLSDYVKLNMSSEIPLLVQYDFGGGSLKYYLAPKVRPAESIRPDARRSQTSERIAARLSSLCFALSPVVVSTAM